MSGAGRRTYALQLLICSLMWSSGYVLTKDLVDTVDPFVISSVRAVIAASVLAAISIVRRVAPWPSRQEFVPWLVLGTFNGWLPNVLTAYALARAPAGLSALIQSSGPLFVAMISHLAFDDDRLSRRKLGGLIIGLAGIATLIGPALFDFGNGSTVAGLLIMVGVSLSYASANVYAKTIPHIEPARMALGQQVISAICATFLALIFGGLASFTPIGEALPAMLGLSLISTAAPITIFMYMIRAQGPTKASMTGYLIPVFAYGLAILFLVEPLGLREVIGGSVALFGVYFVSTAHSRHRKIG
jgi:drug/metabolite transporter (DMT)-like permease